SIGFAFFFQAEDGIRDFHVTGVQTCALPISSPREMILLVLRLPFRFTSQEKSFPSMGRALIAISTPWFWKLPALMKRLATPDSKIGRASCRERVESWAVGAPVDAKARSVRAE